MAAADGDFQDRGRIDGAGESESVAVTRIGEHDVEIWHVRREHEGAIGQHLVVLHFDVTAREAPVAVQVVVHAEQVLNLRLARRLLGDVVEADARGVRLRIDLQDIEAGAIEAAGRNAAEDTAVGETAGGVGGVAGLVRRVVADEGEQDARLVDGLREVAGTLKGGGDGDAGRSGGRIEAFLVLMAVEKEELLAVGIEDFRDEDRAADGEAEIALIDALFVDVVGGRAVAVVDPGVGAHAVVTAEAISGAMEVLGAATGHGADLRAGGTAIFGLVIGGEHLELGDRVEVQAKESTVVAGVDDGHAIERQVVGAAAKAVGEDVGDRIARTVVGIEDDARNDGSQRRKATAVHRDTPQNLSLQRKRAFSAGRLHQRGFGRHAHRIGGRTDFQRHIAQGEFVIGHH